MELSRSARGCALDLLSALHVERPSKSQTYLECRSASCRCPDSPLRLVPKILKSQLSRQLPADFPLELFETAISQLIHHPEYNSTLILRSETISTALPPAQSQHLPGLHPHSNVHRKLLPRRPGRDAALEQHRTLYAYDEAEFAGLPCTLVLTPLAEKESLLYYHPAVFHLAFRYIPSCLSPTTLRIEVIPLPNTPTDPLSGFTVPPSPSSAPCTATAGDMYLLMCERYKRPVDGRRGVTDPLKHVFEDIGIATFLMLFWKDTFGPVSSNDYQSINSDTDSDTVPRNTWPRPPGGFVDLGCGNGLLTHILTAEGYSGHGIDLRACTSWGYYPPSTQRALHVWALDATHIGGASSNNNTNNVDTLTSPKAPSSQETTPMS
ncbi:DUF1613-domain-containing protein [Leucogyrophana mollusca]|uniref:DUF1613-domain-containing protein n=1 Tax=Leucogyrophana mollusca TaxID=85980 RepID=A0ACB8AXU3_9AGAM|nr:DUF1613-domain-containing protein [Leucogyrophana mollusca]